MVVIPVSVKLPDCNIPGEVDTERGNRLIAERFVNARFDDIPDELKVIRTYLIETLIEFAMKLRGLVCSPLENTDFIADPEIFQVVYPENSAELLAEIIFRGIVRENTGRECLYVH
jgi:hypothetical protein